MKQYNIRAEIATRSRQIATGAIKQNFRDQVATFEIFESATSLRRLRS
jgi:hypothetical protein